MVKKSTENINTWISQINNEYRTAISVDCVIFGYNDQCLKVLTTPCDMPPFEGTYSLVGDLLHPDETLTQAAERILHMRTGLTDVVLEQVEAFSGLDRHPLGRVVTIAYYSLLQLDDSLLKEVVNHANLMWQDVQEVQHLAFDHKEIMDRCLQSLQSHLRERPIGFSLLPEQFSLKQIQTLYETVLGVKLDKRNFRRKLKALNILIDIGETQEMVSHRPAKLYSFDKDAYKQKRKTGFTFQL